MIQGVGSPILTQKDINCQIRSNYVNEDNMIL